jgi:hypothetical protein
MKTSESSSVRAHLKQVFDAIRLLMEPPEKTPKRPIGFVTPDEKPKAKAARRC